MQPSWTTRGLAGAGEDPDLLQWAPSAAPSSTGNSSERAMTPQLRSKYGDALTGSDWPGLPLRIGHIPDSGRLQDLSSNVDSVLVWSGGPCHVAILYEHPTRQVQVNHDFHRCTGMVDLLPRGTRLLEIEWKGNPSTCISVNLPSPCLNALCSEGVVGLNPEAGPLFGLIDAHLVDLVHRLKEQAEGTEYWGALYVQSLSMTLATYVSSRYAQGPASSLPARSARLSSDQCWTIERFIDREIAGNFGLVELANLLGYSPDHFSRLFRKTYHQSPHQYILSRRIELAKTMLRDNEKPIAEIAVACGFSSQGHLTTAFKQRTGITPGAFRNR